MKKIIFYICCMLTALATQVEAQEILPKSEAIQLIQKGLDSTAELAKYSFEEAVKAQPVKSITTIISIMILSIIGIGMFIFSEKLRAKDNIGKSKDYWEFWEGKYGGIKGISLFFIGIAVVIFIFEINSIVLGFTNPEYLAIKELLNIINSVT